jgi:small subunit ribosomal protein S14
MAKLSVIARQTKERKLVATHAAKRKALKEAGDYLGSGQSFPATHRLSD